MRTGFQNRPGVVYEATDLQRVFAQDMQDIADFINNYTPPTGDYLLLTGGTLTGDLEIAKTLPKITLKSGDDSNYYAELKRSLTNRALTLKNYVATPASNVGGLLLNGSSDYINLDSNISAFKSLSAGTISLWFKTTNANSRIFYLGASAYSADGFFINIVAGKLSFNIFNANITKLNFLSTASVNDGNWHLLVIRGGAGGNSIFLDNSALAGAYSTGSSATTSWLSDTQSASGTHMTLGAGYVYNNSLGGYFNGSLDDCAFWTSKLSDAFVSEIWNSGNGLYFATNHVDLGTNLLALWRFDDQAGITVTDSKGGYNGILTGGNGDEWLSPAKITVSASVEFGTILEYIDGSNAGERGIAKLGDASSRTVFQGLTHRYNILGVEVGKLQSTGWLLGLPQVINGTLDAIHNKIIGYSSQTYDILQVLLYGASNPSFSVSATGSVIVGGGALATNATAGFLYIPASAGAPTGVPTAKTGRVALHFDSTNNNFYVYNGAWKKVAVA